MPDTQSRFDRPSFRWLSAAVWTLIILAYMAFLAIELRLDYGQVLLPCEGPGCNWAAITEAEFAALESWGLPVRTYADVLIGGMIVTAAVYSFLGLLIFWRQGTTRIGFFVSLLLIVLPIAAYADADNVAANYPALGLPAIMLSIIGVGLQFILIYLFPNGRFYPRWAPVVLGITLANISVSLLTFGNFIEIGPLEPFFSNFTSFFILIGVAVILQFWRYFRVATSIERLQTRWVLLGFIFYFMGPFLWFVFYGGEVAFEPGVPRLIASMGGWILLQGTQLLFLITVAVAVLRYRLWDIDLIIRRTLLYGSLTGLLALLYFGGVVTLQGTFGRLTGQASSPLVTVISTLVIAALFNPLRHRLQGFIDQRFYRRKYDAEQSVARFAASARDEVDLHRLAGALLSTVEETVQPENASLWINQ